jgi:hypothetical protein
MSVTDSRGCFESPSNNRDIDAHRGWLCPKCNKRHLAFRTECGHYRRCVECDAEALDFVRGLCNACYQRELRREKQNARPIIPCAVCGKYFKPKRSGARYCSDRCRQRAHRATHDEQDS